MNLVDDLIALQINYNLYHNNYCVNRDIIAQHLKRTLEHLNILDLPIKTTSRIIDGIYRHPINIRLKMPATTDINIIQSEMLRLRDQILDRYLSQQKQPKLKSRKRSSSHSHQQPCLHELEIAA